MEKNSLKRLLNFCTLRITSKILKPVFHDCLKPIKDKHMYVYVKNQPKPIPHMLERNDPVRASEGTPLSLASL